MDKYLTVDSTDRTSQPRRSSASQIDEFFDDDDDTVADAALNFNWLLGPYGPPGGGGGGGGGGGTTTSLTRDSSTYVSPVSLRQMSPDDDVFVKPEPVDTSPTSINQSLSSRFLVRDDFTSCHTSLPGGDEFPLMPPSTSSHSTLYNIPHHSQPTHIIEDINSQGVSSGIPIPLTSPPISQNSIDNVQIKIEPSLAHHHSLNTEIPPLIKTSSPPLSCSQQNIPLVPPYTAPQISPHSGYHPPTSHQNPLRYPILCQTSTSSAISRLYSTPPTPPASDQGSPADTVLFPPGRRTPPPPYTVVHTSTSNTITNNNNSNNNRSSHTPIGVSPPNQMPPTLIPDPPVVKYSRRNNPELEKRRIHHCDHPGKYQI